MAKNNNSEQSKGPSEKKVAPAVAEKEINLDVVPTTLEEALILIEQLTAAGETKDTQIEELKQSVVEKLGVIKELMVTVTKHNQTITDQDGVIEDMMGKIEKAPIIRNTGNPIGTYNGEQYEVRHDIRKDGKIHRKAEIAEDPALLGDLVKKKSPSVKLVK